MLFRKQSLKLFTGALAAFMLLGAFPFSGDKVNAADQSDVLEIPAITEKTLSVPKITQNTLEVPAIKQNTLTVSKAEILKKSGNMTYKGQEYNYSYTAPRDGTYRFELSGIDESGVTIKDYVRVKDPDGSYLDYTYGGNGSGVTVKLNANKTYTVTVEQCQNFGSFTLLIGQAKEIKNIANYTKVKDSTEYTDQLNVYSLTAPRTGTYRFELADINTSGATIKDYVRVRNADGDYLDYTYGGNGSGVTVKLDAGKKYTVEVEQYEKLGSYTLIVGQPKEIKNIVSYTEVKDSTQYTDQLNEYSLTAPRSGTYRFEFADINTTGTAIKFYVRVRNADGNYLDYTYGGNGTGVTVKLEADKKYTIEVEQYEKLGTYTLIVGQPKETKNIGSYTKIKDYTQYTDQVNTYSLTASRTGTYRFELADIDTTGATIKNYVRVKNTDGNYLDYVYGGNGSGVTVKLEANKLYTVEVEQYEKLGSYSLIVGQQKKTTDISNYHYVKDCTQFTDQINKYSFVPAKDATYTFWLEDIVNDGVTRQVYLRAKNPDGDLMNYITVSGRGKGVKVNLEKGKNYTIEVEQYTNFMSYTLVVGVPGSEEIKATPTPKPTATTAPTKKPTATPTQSAKKTGWKLEGKYWYYYNVKGVKVTAWQKIEGTWYYFNSKGIMLTGWQQISSKWYYFGTSGAMATGWVQDGKNWYFMGDTGVMATGWIKDGNKWYYMNAAGAMTTGWIQDGGKWYYMSPSGAMATGWVQYGKVWYYMNSSGAMVTGWLQDGTHWYYFDSTGAMKTGWLTLGNNKYYLSDSGAMVTGTQKIDGKTYKFNSSGVLISG